MSISRHAFSATPPEGRREAFGARKRGTNAIPEYVAGDRIDRWILNRDALRDLDLDAEVEVWVGGRLAILCSDHDRHGGNTDLAVDLRAGAGLNSSTCLLHCVHGKAVITDDSSFALVLGLRF